MDTHQRNRRLGLITILAGITACLVLVAAVLYIPYFSSEWKQPLGPGLELPTRTPTSAIQQSPVTPTRETTLAPEDTPVAASTPLPEPLCGGPQVMTVLAIGADSGKDYLYGLADVIRIARVDFVTPKVTMLSLPRDLWVELPPGIQGNQVVVTHSKLNQAYFYGGEGMGYYDGPGAGPGLLARTLDLNFGLPVDHYGAVNMQTFVKIVDAVGGIDIYLPNDVDGTPVDSHTADMGFFKAGQHHLNGEEALRFSRIRKRYSDFARQDNQTMVMCALREKLLRPAVLTKVPELISAFDGSILTDLSPEQISQLACLLPQLPSENLIFTGLPDEILTPTRVYNPVLKSNTFVLDADFDVIRSYVSEFLAGVWPTQPEEPTCP